MSAEKIRPTHRQRAAYVYIRQSTLQQVRHHQESRRRQYELQEHARELGFSQVILIDEDLGVSGSGSRERPGFGRLLTPDRQVQEAIRGVFLQFRRFGSVRQVLLWYRQERLALCSYERNARGQQEVVWALPIYNRLLAILKNPVYAGAFAYGRTTTRS